jgi:deoxyribodipyrimidine photo-lyase
MPTASASPVLYWMSRDQRCSDNWALLYASETAAKAGAPLGVVFNLVDSYLGAQARQFAFMLRGLRIVEEKLRSLGIPLFLLKVSEYVCVHFCSMELVIS